MGTYTNVFGGFAIQTALQSYLSITLNGNLTLNWGAQFQDTNNVVANIIDVTPTGGGFNITMPDATQTSVGQTVIFNNLSGGNAFSILNNTGGLITAVAHGNIFYLYLVDNTTVAGTWHLVPFGVGIGGVVTSVAAVSATSPALTITGSPITSAGTFTFTLDTDLVALDSLGASTGLAVRTGVGTWSTVTLIAGTNITITNGNGVAGNPTIAVNNNLVLTSLTAGNINLTANTISSTVGNLSVIPFTAGNLFLGSNATPIRIDTNDNVTNVNSITTTSTTAGNLTMSSNSIVNNFVNASISIVPNGTGSALLGSNVMPFTIDSLNNVTHVNSLTGVVLIGTTGVTAGNLTASSNSIVNNIVNANISIVPNGTGSLLLGSNANPFTIDSLNNVTHVNSLTAANITATTSLATTFHPSPIAAAWIYFTGSTATVLNSFNVGSLTRSAAGIYTINWSVVFPSGSYPVVVSADYNAAAFVAVPFNRMTTSTQIHCVSLAGADADATISVVVYA